MPVITLPTGQIMAIPEGIAPAMTIPAQVAQVGQQLPPPVGAPVPQPAQLSPTEKAAKIAQWVAFKERQYLDAGLDPTAIEHQRLANIKKYESFLGLTPSDKGAKGYSSTELTVQDQLKADQNAKQKAFDETVKQKAARGGPAMLRGY